MQASTNISRTFVDDRLYRDLAKTTAGGSFIVLFIPRLGSRLWTNKSGRRLREVNSLSWGWGNISLLTILYKPLYYHGKERLHEYPQDVDPDASPDVAQRPPGSRPGSGDQWHARCARLCRRMAPRHQ